MAASDQRSPPPQPSPGSWTIEFGDLWWGSHDDRRPLATLPSAGDEHIHGRLQIFVDHRPLPALGYFGPDDVCFGEWMSELRSLGLRMASDYHAVYVYDEGEQGQPAYRFARDQAAVRVSVVEGLGGGQAEPEWQDVETSYPGLVHAIETFLQSASSAILDEAGESGAEWLRAISRS